MKVRLMCMTHECDLYRDDHQQLVPEMKSDVLNGVGVGSATDGETGYYLFDLSGCGCPEDQVGGGYCNDQWHVVIYY